ncbi:hypothetical protein PHMEG_0004605 [Phytophthora megakarya]|uniref:Uncharacterized protein n=1 Tax=Phytophthora megakarya TaxID=4795 RepID=A0A225WVI5_9STRA|nr:hypothetical protein PHMEG_0004605 [Phytophthora megakarya]
MGSPARAAVRYRHMICNPNGKGSTWSTYNLRNCFAGAVPLNTKGLAAPDGTVTANSLSSLPASAIPRMKQTTIGETFIPQSSQMRKKSRRRDFQKLKRQQAKQRIRRERDKRRDNQNGERGMHADERSYELISQNVRGFGASDSAHRKWLHSLGRTTTKGFQDLALVQETYVHASHVDDAQRDYAARWGYRHGSGCPLLSYWGAAVDQKGGEVFWRIRMVLLQTIILSGKRPGHHILLPLLVNLMEKKSS